MQSAAIFGDLGRGAVNQTNQRSDATSTPSPQASPLSPEESTDLSLIIGSVCVVGLFLVVSVFIFVLCRMCHSGSHVNRALLGKVPMERGSDVGDCSGNNSSSGRKATIVDANSGLVSGGDGRFITFGGSPPAGAFCLANTMAASEIPSPNKPVEMYSAFNGNGELLSANA